MTMTEEEAVKVAVRMHVIGFIHPKAGGDDEQFELCLGDFVDSPAAREYLGKQVVELLEELGSAVFDDYVILPGKRDLAACEGCNMREGCFDVITAVEE